MTDPLSFFPEGAAQSFEPKPDGPWWINTGRDDVPDPFDEIELRDENGRARRVTFEQWGRYRIPAPPPPPTTPSRERALEEDRIAREEGWCWLRF